MVSGALQLSHQDLNNVNQELDRLAQHAKQVHLDLQSGKASLQESLSFFDTLIEKINQFEEAYHHITQQQLHLKALVDIGQAVNSTLALDHVLQTVMDNIIRITGAERSFLMLTDENDRLYLRIGRKWEREAITEADDVISRTIAQRVFLEGQIILTSNAQEDPRFNNLESITNYQLRSILCVPLRVKEKIIGVIYADNRVQSGVFNDNDSALLSALADQAAIAIENATLFGKVQHSVQEINEAYDATIQGWAQALEFRDYETQGHCRRVTELTLLLAKALNIAEDELIHIRRGAILHDVGKMGISDRILLKPGPLTQEEWEIIRLHPEYGYEFLKKIPFLRQAMPIVRYHHEHWNGKGYPKGLKEEEIPLPARIFSVADVWDALVHARPYKRPWSKDEALFYIQSQAGDMFDPQVVQAFLDLFQKDVLYFPYSNE